VPQSRLDDILGSETRNGRVAKHEVDRVIRTTKDREPDRDAVLVDARVSRRAHPSHQGRAKIDEEIFNQPGLANSSDFGIELLDVRFKTINYNESVQHGSTDG